MLSVVFAHQLVAVIMFVIVLATIARLYLDKNMIGFRRLVVCSIPAGIMFSAIIYADYLTSSQFSVVSSFLGQGSEGFAALFGFASHADLITDTLGFLVFCYLPLTPLLLLGTKRFKNNLQLKVWVLLILIMLLSVIISPNAFFAVFPYRWTLLLVYPLAFYVTEGFAGLGSNLYKVCVGLMLTTLSLGFVALPNNSPFPYYGAYQLYMPTSMLQNTVPMVDCQSTTNALLWLENNMNENARLLAHRAFFGWALLTLNESQIELYEYGNPSDAARTLVQQGIGQVYLVWWTNGTGWHGQQNVSSSFEEVYHSDRIAVYRYSGSM
jgi:TM2 domain-containing membrane protein YozV